MSKHYTVTSIYGHAPVPSAFYSCACVSGRSANVFRLRMRIIKTRTELGRPGTEASRTASMSLYLGIGLRSETKQKTFALTAVHLASFPGHRGGREGLGTRLTVHLAFNKNRKLSISVPKDGKMCQIKIDRQ